MRFFIGALALTVICALFGAPALIVLGRSPLSASDRQDLSAIKKDRGRLSHIEKQLGTSVHVKTAVN
jgi:hypothetical protein